jgi:pimeloyl-ACP methyl ester carboxylesterase
MNCTVDTAAHTLIGVRRAKVKLFLAKCRKVTIQHRAPEHVTEKIPLLLLPGLLCDRRLWAPQMASLADITEPIVADLTRDASIEAMARRALASLPPRFAVAGLSMGGYVAHEIIGQAPERVIRLALLDTSARADTPGQRQRRRDLIALSHRGQFHGVTQHLLQQLIHPDRLGDASLVKIIKEMAESVGIDGFRRQEAAILARRDRRSDLTRITAPTLVLCGREDLLTPLALAEEMAALVPNAELHIVEHCGHITTLERPNQVSDALRQWLTR